MGCPLFFNHKSLYTIHLQSSAHSRTVVGELLGAELAADIRILYGGSCKPTNARELFALPDVDGGLIGGASLDAESFVGIVEAAVALV